MRKLFAALALLSTLAVAQAPKISKSAAPEGPAIPGVPASMHSIDTDRIRAQVKFLSDDLLEGRGTGQRGGDVAARYLAAQFELYGLKPAGDNGSYFQKVPMVGVTTDQKASKFAIVPTKGGAMNLTFGADYITTNLTQTESVDVDAPIVFAGYGIDAPEYQWNDFKEADVRGKVLMLFVNEPPSDDPKFFTGRALTYYGRWTYKYEQAARKGAVGVLLIHKTEMASYGWDVVKNSWSGEKSYLHIAPGEPKLKAASWIQLEVARKALAAAGQDLDKLLAAAKSRDFQPIALPLALKAHIVSKVRPFVSNNVVAVLPGSDARLKEQAIFYTAHYDHFGVHADEKGDNIYNGALDNGTGCAIVLELARAWSQAVPRPKRSIYFAAVTAEEQGLLGSEYLGKHPPLPAKNIQLDLNFDDVKPYGYPEQLEVVGYDRTSFAPVVEQVAKAFGLKIMPDASPEAGHYYRSDHFSMARVGVPAFSVNAGRKFRGKTEALGDQMYDAYTAKDYHQPSDEYREEFDFTSNTVLAKFGFALGWKAAQQPGEVQWKKGDEFERARKGPAPGTPE
jgi:Zn-dependent M28 family amino/carboxypeptidase